MNRIRVGFQCGNAVGSAGNIHRIIKNRCCVRNDFGRLDMLIIHSDNKSQPGSNYIAYSTFLLQRFFHCADSFFIYTIRSKYGNFAGADRILSPYLPYSVLQIFPGNLLLQRLHIFQDLHLPEQSGSKGFPDLLVHAHQYYNATAAASPSSICEIRYNIRSRTAMVSTLPNSKLNASII